MEWMEERGGKRASRNLYEKKRKKKKEEDRWRIVSERIILLYLIRRWRR